MLFTVCLSSTFYRNLTKFTCESFEKRNARVYIIKEEASWNEYSLISNLQLKCRFKMFLNRHFGNLGKVKFHLRPNVPKCRLVKNAVGSICNDARHFRNRKNGINTKRSLLYVVVLHFDSSQSIEAPITCYLVARRSVNARKVKENTLIHSSYVNIHIY